jgi:hypothetical protein
MTLAAVMAAFSPLAAANDFPTQARVEYVLGCMTRHGGQSYNTLYPCICKIDKIAEKITYKEYSSAEMLTFLWSTPGERGGVFRDAATDSRKRVKHLAEVIEEAENSCFIR